MNATALTLRQVRYVNKAFWRNPASAFFTFAFPLMFLVIFTALLGHSTVRVGTRTVNTSTYYVASMAAFASLSLLGGLLAKIVVKLSTLWRTSRTSMPSGPAV